MSGGPSEEELRVALEALLEEADMTAVSYSQLHKQLEERFDVSDVSCFCADMHNRQHAFGSETVVRSSGVSTCRIIPFSTLCSALPQRQCVHQHARFSASQSHCVC